MLASSGDNSDDGVILYSDDNDGSDDVSNGNISDDRTSVVFCLVMIVSDDSDV